MSLVDIKNFKGSLVANEALSNMLDTGISLYCKSFGYIINVSPDMEKTPKGKIEDSPNSHRIVLERNVNIDLNDTRSDKDIIEANNKDNIKLNVIFGYLVTNKSTVTINEETNTKWYNHVVEITVKRNENEDNEDYALRITEVLYKFIQKN